MAPTLLPDALVAIAHVLAPRRGRAVLLMPHVMLTLTLPLTLTLNPNPNQVLLMTRVAAARVPLCMPPTLRLESTLDVV